MFVPPKQQQQDALIVIIDHNKIHGGFAIDPCPCFSFEVSDIADGIIHNFLSFQQVLEQINITGHQDQPQLPLILVVSREQQMLQELSQHIFLNTGFKIMGLIFRDTALLFYQSRPTCLIVDFKQRAISILLSIDGVTDDIIVIERSMTVDNRLKQVLSQQKRYSSNPDQAIDVSVAVNITRQFDNESLAHELRNSALMQEFYEGIDLWALHIATRVPNAVMECIARACQRYQQFRPGQQLPIILTGECSMIAGFEQQMAARISQLPKAANCKLIAAGDRWASEFLGAAAAVQVVQEQLFFTELDPWEGDAGKAIFQ